jgi:hypothetical protein
MKLPPFAMPLLTMSNPTAIVVPGIVQGAGAIANCCLLRQNVHAGMTATFLEALAAAFP